MSLFALRRQSPHANKSVISPAVALPLGTALAYGSDGVSGVLADGMLAFAGFMILPTQVGGPALGDVIYPGRLALPGVAGQEVGLWDLDEYEAESSQYLLLTSAVDSVSVSNGGSGYTSAPTVAFTGGGGTVQATGVAVISGGKVVAVVVTNRGLGYTSAPTIAFTGGAGTGAAAAAVMGGAINGSTPAGTALAFYNGMTCVQMTGQDHLFTLVAQQTPETSGNDAGIAGNTPGAPAAYVRILAVKPVK